MGLNSLFAFSDNIRAHAIAVGVIFTLGAFGSLLVALVLYLEEPKKQPEMGRTSGLIMKSLLVVGNINLFFTSLYWTGFVHRVRWCLTVIIGILVASIPVQFIILLFAIVHQELLAAYSMPIFLAIIGYVLLVMFQLEAKYSRNLSNHSKA